MHEQERIGILNPIDSFVWNDGKGRENAFFFDTQRKMLLIEVVLIGAQGDVFDVLFEKTACLQKEYDKSDQYNDQSKNENNTNISAEPSILRQ